MNDELKQLFNQYQAAGNTETFDQFLQAKEELGDEMFYNYVNSQIDLKKKDQPSLTETSSPEISLSGSGQNPPISQELQGEPMETWMENVPMGSEMDPIFYNQPLDQVSSASDITAPQPSTVLPLTETASSGIGDTIPEGVVLPRNPNNLRLTNIEPYIQQNSVGNIGLGDTAQQTNPITITQAEQTGEDIFSQVPAWMTDKTEEEKKEEQEYFNKYISKDYINGNLKPRIYTEGQFIGGDKQSLGINSEGKELTSKFYNTPEEGIAKMNDYLKKGYVTFENNSDGKIATDESGVPLGRLTKLGEETFNTWAEQSTSEAKENIGDKNLETASHNYYQSLGDKANRTPLQDYYDEYYKKTGELFDSTNDERITTEQGQAEVLAEGIARKRVKENPGLDFNTEYQKALKQELPYTDEQLSVAGRNLLLGTFVNAVNTTENGHRISAESKGQTYQSEFDKEKDWLQIAANNPVYAKEFADYWFNSDSGIKKYGASETRLNAMLNSQEGRAEIFDDFENYRQVKDGSLYEANKNIIDKTKLKIKKAKENRDENALRQNIDKLNSVSETINLNKGIALARGTIDDMRKKAQTIVLKQNMELAKNEADYENATLGTLRGHVGAILNGITDAGKDLALGIPRLVNTIAGDNDAVNYVLDEISKPTQILNVRSSGITDTVSTYKLNGKTIVNRNGFWFEKSKNGDLVPTTISSDGMSKMQLEETKKDFSAKGLFGTVANQATMMFGAELAGGKVLSLLSKGLGRTVSAASEVYGAESSMVKGLQMFDKFAKNPTNNGIIGWTLNTIEGNAQEAEMRGMKGGDKAMFILTQSFITGLASKISPDVKFFKEAKTLEEGLIQALRNGNQAAVKTLVNNFTTALPKAMLREVAPELLQEYSERFLKSAGEIVQTVATGNNQLSAITSDEIIDTAIQTAATVATLGAIGHIRGGKKYEYEGQTYNIAGLNKNEQLSLLANIYNPTTFAEFKNKFGVSQDRIDKVENEVRTVKKYIDQIPNREDYTLNGMFRAGVILQEIERLKQSKTTAAEVFHENIDAKISAKTQELKDVLENNKVEKTNSETNENPQPTPEQETTQEQTTTTESDEPEQSPVQQTEPIAPIEPNGNGGAEVGVDTNINTETNGQTASEIESATRQVEGVGQASQEAGQDTASKPTEVVGSDTQSQETTEAPAQAEVEYDFSNIQPVGKGFFGNIYDQFKGKAKEAVAFLLQRKEGDIIGALNHKDIGDIDLIWGNETAGLMKIANKHPEMLEGLQDKISKMEVKSSSSNRIVLENSDARAVVSKNAFENESKNWLLTAYELKKDFTSASSIDNETKSVETDMQIDTAPLQSEISNTNIQNTNQNKNLQTTQSQQVTTEDNQQPADQTDEADNTGVQSEEGKTTEIITLSNPEYSLKVDTDSRGVKTFTLLNKSGKEVNPSSATRRKYLLEYLKNSEFQETQIPEEASPKDAHYIILNESKNPHELALALANTEKYRGDAEVGSKLWHIADKMRRVKSKGVKQFGDKNKFTAGIAKSYFSRKNKPSENGSKNTIDQWAMEASSAFAGDYGGNEITTDDIVSFIEEYPNGADQYLKQKTDEYRQIEQRFFEITGLNPTENVLAELSGKKASDEQSKLELKKRAEEYYDTLTSEQQKKLADEYDEWFNSLTLEQQQEELIKTYPYDIQGISTKTGQTKNQPQSGNTEGQGGKNADAKSGAEGSQKGQKVKPTSPEYKAAILRRDEAERNLKTKKDNLSRVSAKTNKDFQADQTDIFGNRISQEQPGMFDERADGNAGKEIIAKAKRELEEAQKEFTAANKAVKDFESGNIQGTKEISFDEPKQTPSPKRKIVRTETDAVKDTKKNAKINAALEDFFSDFNKDNIQSSVRNNPEDFIPMDIPTFQKFFDKLKKPFAKAFRNLKVTYDWNEFSDRAKALGSTSVDFLFGKASLKPSYRSLITKASLMELQGLPFSQIQEETGLVKSPQGEWKFIIDDSNADFLISNKQIKELVESKKSLNLEDVLRHDELFNQYPRLKNKIRLKFINESNDNYAQVEYNTQEKVYEITVNIKEQRLLPNRDLQTSILHETQHVLQGFVLGIGRKGGANADVFFDALKNNSVTLKDSNGNVIDYNKLAEDKVKAGVFGNKDEYFNSLSYFLYNNHADEIEARATSDNNLSREINELQISKVVVQTGMREFTIKDIKFMHTATGEVYGAKLPDGTLYFNPEKLNKNTAFHELSHLWEQMMPTSWKKGVEIFKQSTTGKKIFDQLKEEGNYPNLTDEQLWSEALNTHLGNYGEWKDRNPKGKMSELRDWFLNIAKRIGDYFGIRNMTPDEKLGNFADKVIGDIKSEKYLKGESNTEDTNVQFSLQSQTPENRASIIVKGVKLIDAYIDAGIYKFMDIASDADKRFDGISEEMFNGLKTAYSAYIANADDNVYSKMDANIRDFSYDMLFTAEPEQEVDDFINRIQSELQAQTKLDIRKIRSIAREFGLDEVKDTTLQEYVEVAIIKEAKSIAAQDIPRKEKYSKILELYKTQPTISMRSGNRVELQQYSTPIPMSFLVGEFINNANPDSVLEPSAGNGMMVFNIDASKITANEIDEVRLENLQKEGFKEVLNQDGREPFVGKFGALVTNPPFGKSEAKNYNGYNVSGLDPQMVINGLNSLEDNGVAAIIIGGNTEYNENGSLKSSKAFFNYLYNYYNVVDVINMDGQLYQKQGTTFPTRMILIAGRKRELVDKSNFKTTDFAPVQEEANAEPVKTFGALYNRVEQAINKVNDTNLLQRDTQRADADSSAEPSEKNNRVDDKGKTALSGKKSSDERGEYLPGDSRRDDGYGDSNGRGRTNQRYNADNGDGTLDSGNERGEGNSGRKRGESDVQDGRTPILSDDATGSGGEPVSVDLSKEKAPYPAQSKSIQVGSVVPTNMAQPIANALREIGDVDAFVANKLGYNSKEELFGAMSAEQIDGVALAISQVEKGKGFIIGDMTGVGKGRQAAAMIRYAVEQGKRPIFITEKATLFSDIYRDLRDIGSGHLRPFIMNNKASDSDPNMTDENGNVVYATPKDNIKKQIFENGELPEEYDYMVMTYSQVNSEKTAQKRRLLRNLAENSIMILDESHNAGGQSQTGEFFQSVLDTTQGAVYLSGTFAKSHQNMPVYAIRTDMKDANMSQDEMIEAINKGGVPLMEIMSGDLVKAGQMIRRERDFTGVTIDWEMYDQDKEAQSKKFDQATVVFNEIISFEENHITPFIKNMDKALAKEQGNAKKRKGTNQMGVSNTPFASSLFNVVRQMLFSLKAEHIADQAIKELKAGRKPVIAFGSTMEGFLDEIGNGNTVDTHDFSLAMKRGLKSTLKYTVTDANGDNEHKFFELDELPLATQKAYKELESKIENISTGLPISPIDVIKNKIQQAGYSVGEMTGRKSELKFNDDGTAEVVSRKDRDKKKLARQFNFGDIDVLMLNQSASTGISLHASKTFGDQRQRVMIFAQSQLDVNTEIQMRGRIDRTGQVLRGAYRYITSMIPAELRLTMMLKAKLKKLDATTTSDQKSKTNEIKVSDFLNKYGDDIVFEYLVENPELNAKLLDPLKVGDKDISELKTAPENLASKVSGKVALLTTSEQERFYKEVSERYDAHIKYLDENNANDLEIKPLDLKAETKSIKTLIAGKQTGSVFGEDSMMEQVEMNILKKPMTSQEIKAEVEKVLNGKTSAEYKEDLVTKAEEQLAIQNEKDADKIKNEKISATAMAKYEKNAVEMGLIREGEDATEYINSFAEKDKNEKIKEVQYKNRIKFNNIISTFRYFSVGQDYMIPFDAKITTDTAYVNGKFLGFKVKDKYNPSSIVAIFATHDSRRKIEVPLSQVDYINAIKARPASRWDIITDEKWDKSIPTSSRKLGYIATGNLLQAYGTVNGQLISFTTKDGKIRQGILMPDNYKPEAQKMKVPITQVEGLLIDGRAVGDISGEVFIYPSGNGYAIEVPSSKAKGAKYFSNPEFKSLMNGNGFDRQVGSRFVANFNKQNLTNVLETLYKNYNTSVFTEAVSKKVEESGSESLSTQARKKNLAPERIAPAKTSPSAEPKSKSQMVGDLARGINATIKYAKTGQRNALGTYDARSTLIRIKNAGDLDTVAHEVGHLLDDRFDIFGTIDIADKVVIDDQLKWFSDRGGSNPPTNATPAQKSEYLQREGIAEFVRAYIVNKSEARKKALELFKHFENSIDAETKKVLAQYSKDVLDFENAHPFDQIGANVDSIKPEKKNRIKETFKYLREKDVVFGNRLWSDFNVNFLNVMSRANKAFLYINKIQGTDENILPENDFRILNRLFNGVYGKIDRILKDGLVDSKNKFLKDEDGNNMSVRWLFEPLDHSSEKVLEKEMEDVSKMLIAERTIEYARKFGRTDGLSGIGSLTKDDLTVAEDAMAYLEEMKAKNPQRYERLALATERYREYADKVLRYSVDKGRISEESYKAIKDGNLFYVNMMRIKESAPTEEDVDNLYKNSSSITSSKEVIKKATGGSDRLRNPYDALLMTTAAIIREADRNEVMHSFIEPMRNNRKIGDGDPVDFTKVAWRAKPGDKFTRKIFIDGKLEEWAFAPEIITAVESLDGIMKDLPLFLKPFEKLASSVRWTVTNDPSFASRNLIRDTVSTAINSYTVKGIKDLDLRHNKSDRQAFDLFGGGLAGYHSDKDRYKKEIQSAMKSVTAQGGIVVNISELPKKYKQLLEKSENVNRIAEFKRSFKEAKDKGWDDYNAGLYAAARARDLLDFAVAGKHVKQLNRIITFLNAGVQSLARTARYAKENPRAYALKSLIFTGITQAIIRAITKLYDDDDDYNKLPAYQRDFFWNFRLPFTGGKWISIPKPFENGLASSFADRLYSYYTGDENALDGFSESVTKSLVPVDDVNILGSTKPIIEVMTNKDLFRDKNIVSYWDQDKMREERKSDEYASRLSKGVTNIIYDLSMKNVDINPNNVDHLIKGYTTKFGTTALALSDIGREDTRNKLNLSLTGFVRESPVANAKNVQQLTDILKELGKASGKEMKRIKELQEDYYKAETKEEKKRILHKLYDYADEKLEVYKKKKEEIKNNN